MKNGVLRLGLPMWFHSQWRGQLLSEDAQSRQALNEYHRCFSSVEGNTSFYGLPELTRAQQWLKMVDPDFRFNFKLPRLISHGRSDHQSTAAALNLEQGYLAVRDELQAFVEVFGERLGMLQLQLPPSFGVERYSELVDFLGYLQQELGSVALAVECRHGDFFNKGDSEQQMLRDFSALNVARTCFDTRGLFADTAKTEWVLDAQAKKPRMPLHPVATAQSQMVRFIGHSDWQQNQHYLNQWLSKTQQWLAEGRDVYFYIHTAGNHDVIGFSRYIAQLWQQNCDANDLDVVRSEMNQALQRVLQPWPGELAKEAERSGDLFGDF